MVLPRCPRPFTENSAFIDDDSTSSSRDQGLEREILCFEDGEADVNRELVYCRSMKSALRRSFRHCRLRVFHGKIALNACNTQTSLGFIERLYVAQ